MDYLSGDDVDDNDDDNDYKVCTKQRLDHSFHALAFLTCECDFKLTTIILHLFSWLPTCTPATRRRGYCSVSYTHLTLPTNREV